MQANRGWSNPSEKGWSSVPKYPMNPEVPEEVKEEIQDYMKLYYTSTNTSTQFNFDLKVYPNPFNNVCNVTYSLSESAIVSICIYDMMGRTVKMLTQGENEEEGVHSIEFNREGMVGGIYSLVFIDSKGNKTTRQLSIL